MNEQKILEFLQSLDYENGARHFPDDARRSRFRGGWHHAVQGREYSLETLRELTWQNLGWRCGEEFGDQVDSEIDRAFEVLAEEYRTTLFHAIMEKLHKRTGRAADYWPGRFSSPSVDAAAWRPPSGSWIPPKA